MSTCIPFDIQLQIIQRLPIRSLIRFISVCKAWKSFIKSSEFVYSHKQQPVEEQLMMMIKYEVGDREETRKVEFVSFVDDDSFPQQKFSPTVPPLLQSFNVYRIVDSSCGLLYLDGYFREPDDGPATRMVVLWNPTIRKSIAVALPTVVISPFNVTVGFGVCPHTNDPKLVQITGIDDGQKIESISSIPFQVMVFTLSSGEWRCLSGNQMPRRSVYFRGFQVVIGQFIYWLAYDRTVVDGEFRFLNNLMMSFDMSNEEFREVDLPDSLTRIGELRSLVMFRLKESLAVVEYEDYIWYPSKPCVVWMMEQDDSKSFTKLFTIEAPHASIKWIMGFSKSGQPIFESLETDHQDGNTSRQLVVYEPCSGHIKHLGVRGNQYSFFGSSYTESLLLLDHDDGRIIRCGDVKTVGTGLN